LVSRGFSTEKTRKNWKKPKKTLKRGKMETCVCFPGNLPAGSCQVKPSEVNPDLTLVMSRLGLAGSWLGSGTGADQNGSKRL